jgi:hypothetical protein
VSIFFFKLSKESKKSFYLRDVSADESSPAGPMYLYVGTVKKKKTFFSALLVTVTAWYRIKPLMHSHHFLISVL